jgi:hypothetical protein
MPESDPGVPNCDLGPEPISTPYDFCVYLSPSVADGGVHFAIEALNFSDQGACWYTLPTRILIDQEDIEQLKHEDCPPFDGSNPPRECP